MFDLNNLVAEFDEKSKIIHLTAKTPVRCQTRKQGYALARAVKQILKTHLAGERGYLITDYSKIIIEPRHIDEYAGAIREIMTTYLHPGGIARYGFEISRVTAQISHDIYLGGAANLFNTREEAFNFIRGLIAEKSDGEKSPKPRFPLNSHI